MSLFCFYSIHLAANCMELTNNSTLICISVILEFQIFQALLMATPCFSQSLKIGLNWGAKLANFTGNYQFLKMLKITFYR